MLRKHPAFTAAAVLTLAIGFGPPIAIFALANGMVLRPVPGVRHPGSVSIFMTGSPGPHGGLTSGRVSYVNLRDMTSQLHTVELGALQIFPAASVGGNGLPERLLNGEFVSGSYFDVLGVRMQSGRGIGPDDDHPSHPALVAVISDGTWASLFDKPGRCRPNHHHQRPPGDGGRRGRSDFQGNGASCGSPSGARRHRIVHLGLGRPSPDDRATGGYYQFIRVFRPARHGHKRRQVGLIDAVAARAAPRDNAKFSTVGFHNQGPIGDYGQEPLVRLLSLMFGAAVLVLLIASANVASLVLMRGLARREEVAIRRALGASRWRVVRQHVTEAALLWLLGATAGLLLAWMLLKGGLSSRLTAFGIPALPCNSTGRWLRLPRDWRCSSGSSSR